MDKENKVILLDLDDTLNKFGEHFWDLHNKFAEEHVDFKRVHSWDMQQYAKMDNVYELLKYPNLFRNIPLKDGAQSFVRELLNHYTVYFVTDSPAGTPSDHEYTYGFSNPADDKRAWVKENFPFFPKDQIIFCSHKWMVNGDVLIDDKPSTFEKFTEMGRACLLMDAPYNQHIDTDLRVHNLEEAKEKIEEIFQLQKN